MRGSHWEPGPLFESLRTSWCECWAFDSPSIHFKHSALLCDSLSCGRSSVDAIQRMVFKWKFSVDAIRWFKEAFDLDRSDALPIGKGGSIFKIISLIFACSPEWLEKSWKIVRAAHWFRSKKWIPLSGLSFSEGSNCGATHRLLLSAFSICGKPEESFLIGIS